MLATAELHLFNGGPSRDKGGLRDRQEDFSQQGGTAVTNSFIDLEPREETQPVAVPMGCALRYPSTFSMFVLVCSSLDLCHYGARGTILYILFL